MMPQFLCRFVTPNYARASQEHFAGAEARGNWGGWGKGNPGQLGRPYWYLNIVPVLPIFKTSSK